MSLESILVYLFKELKKLFAFSYKYPDEKAVLSNRPPFVHKYYLKKTWTMISKNNYSNCSFTSFPLPPPSIALSLCSIQVA